MTNDIVAFIRARLNETDTALQRLDYGQLDTTARNGIESVTDFTTTGSVVDYLDTFGPDTIRRHLAADHMLLALCDTDATGGEWETWASAVAHALASRFASHPDYRQEWRP